MNRKYEPIACAFYDELEAAAIKKEQCTIIYKDTNDITHAIEDMIIDFQTKNKEEFMLLKSGLILRLDQIISFNDKDPKDHLYC